MPTSIYLAGLLWVAGAYAMNLPSQQMDESGRQPGSRAMWWIFTIEGIVGGIAHWAYWAVVAYVGWRFGWKEGFFMFLVGAAGAAPFGVLRRGVVHQWLHQTRLAIILTCMIAGPISLSYASVVLASYLL